LVVYGSKAALSFLLVWSLLALNPGPAAATPASEAIFAEAETLKGAKRYAEASEKYEAAVAADPKHAAAWYGLAVARRRSGRCDRAIVAYRRYAELSPLEPDPYYGLGLCLMETGARPAALEALKHYVSIDKRPTSQRWVEHANSLIAEISSAGAAGAPGTADPKAAAVAKPGAPTPTTPPPAGAKPAQATSPANPAFVDAQSLRDRGHIDEAITKFQQAIAADPRFMPARAALGELLLKVRRDDEAIEVFKAAVEKNPSYPLAWYNLAFAYRARGRSADAVDAYQHYIKLHPTDPDPYYGLGRALQRLGRDADARTAFETYVAMEKRPSEQRWVEQAQAQLRTLPITK
jgi:tetratricopeptide (TPR) repeat protein